MNSSIKTYKFDDDEDLEAAMDTPKSSVTPTGDKITTAINDENDLDQSLLSSSSNLSRSSSVSSISSRQSVCKKNKGKGFNFYYKQCTICLADFEKGEQVRVIPNCGHTFHSTCLEMWLQRQFRCPNCNIEIS